MDLEEGLRALDAFESLDTEFSSLGVFDEPVMVTYLNPSVEDDWPVPGALTTFEPLVVEVALLDSKRATVAGSEVKAHLEGLGFEIRAHQVT
jgi:hypothetical protein